MKKKFNIAVLASTRGTDLQAIIDEIKSGRLKVELSCVVSNDRHCYALERARAQGFKTYWVDQKDHSRVEFDREVVKILKSENIDLIVLAGYMRILTPYFIGEFRGKIINVHPALLPKYGGKHFYGDKVHEAILKAGEKESGMTIHFVEKEVDRGQIILQKTCPVETGDTVESLKARIQALEREWYPKVIQLFAEDKIKYEKDRV